MSCLLEFWPVMMSSRRDRISELLRMPSEACFLMAFFPCKTIKLLDGVTCEGGGEPRGFGDERQLLHVTGTRDGTNGPNTETGKTLCVVSFASRAK
jgi:hypothetical protein